MNKYQDIKTADDLQKALSAVRKDIKSQEKALDRSYQDLRAHLSPMNLVSGFVQKRSGIMNWANLSLKVVRLLKDRILG